MTLAAAEDLLARLVAFDTTSAYSNIALIDFVADYLADHGIAVQRVESEDRQKASLFATIGPDVAGGAVLSGHTDVVPVADQVWSSDPFVVTQRDGRLHGRGTCDMKGFIACVLALVPDLVNAPLRVPLHLAFSYDEEVGCLAAPALIDALLGAVAPPAFAIIGEPTEMRVAQAHRGIVTFATSITGRAGHSSKPAAGVNAIIAATDCIANLRRLTDDEAVHAPATGEKTTINIGRIEGGTAINIIAGRCRFFWECRSDDEDAGDRLRAGLDNWVQRSLLPAVRSVAPEADVVTERLVAAPPLLMQPGSVAVAMALALSGHNNAERVAFASEAGQFQKAGVPAVVIGPGSAAQAHQPDEYVERAQLDLCVAFLQRLMTWASRAPT